MMQPNRRGLALLLSLAGAPIGCFKDGMRGGEQTSSGSTSSGSSGAPTGTAGTTAVTGTGSSGDASTSTGVVSGSSGGETTGAEVDPQCVAYASNTVMCAPPDGFTEEALIAFCAAIKEQALMSDGDACLAAFEAYLVCVANAPCREFANGGPCIEAMAATEAACPTLFPEETTGTGTTATD